MGILCLAGEDPPSYPSFLPLFQSVIFVFDAVVVAAKLRKEHAALMPVWFISFQLLARFCFRGVLVLSRRVYAEANHQMGRMRG